MGTYVNVVPVGQKPDENFTLEPGIVSQEELESAAKDWGIPLPLAYHDRRAAERDASRLGVILARRSYARKQQKQLR